MPGTRPIRTFVAASLALALVCVILAVHGGAERAYDVGDRIGATFNEVTANSGANSGGGISPLHFGDEPLLP